MEKEYEDIQFALGSSIEVAVNQLLRYRNQGKLAKGEFNEVILYSDTVTMDDAYLSITGKTKAEFDESQRLWKEDYERREREHKESIPALSKYWMNKGRNILTEDRWDYWDEIVPIRLGDLYHGMELGNCLDIVSVLNNGGTLDEAKEVIGSQDHSGMSYGLVCSMVKDFCDRGEEFIKYINYK